MDTLARVATKVFEWTINSAGGRLVVQCSHNKYLKKQELSEDIMTILHTFHFQLTSKTGKPGQKNKRLTSGSKNMSPLSSGVDATTTRFDEENVHGLSEGVFAQ